MWLVLVLLAVSVLAGDFPANVIPKGENPQDGAVECGINKYKLFEVKEPVTWLQADHLCREMGGWLAEYATYKNRAVVEGLIKGVENETWTSADQTTGKISGMSRKEWWRRASKELETRRYFVCKWFPINKSLPEPRHLGEGYERMLHPDDKGK
jgi:hypothetical protein